MEKGKKIERCKDCGCFFGGHTYRCKNLSDKDKLDMYPRLAEAYSTNLNYTEHLRKKITKEMTFWQGKFRIVAHENNMLRRKLYKRCEDKAPKFGAIK